jgi:hypothetical protein
MSYSLLIYSFLTNERSGRQGNRGDEKGSIFVRKGRELRLLFRQNEAKSVETMSGNGTKTGDI